MQGYRRTRECVPARPKLAELVRLRLPFYDRFLHAFGAVPHAGASFAGALPARGTAQTRDGGIVLNPSDWRESGTPRFSRGRACALRVPPSPFLASSEKAAAPVAGGRSAPWAKEGG